MTKITDRGIAFDIHPRTKGDRVEAAALLAQLPDDFKEGPIAGDMDEVCTLVVCTDGVTLDETAGEAQRTFLKFWEMVAGWRAGDGVTVRDWAAFYVNHVVDHLQEVWARAYRSAYAVMTAPDERAPELLTEEERADPFSEGGAPSGEGG